MPDIMKRRIGRGLSRHHGEPSNTPLQSDEVVHSAHAQPSQQPTADDDLTFRLIAIMRELDRNLEPQAFTAAGRPTVDALASRLGHPVSAKARNEAWRQLQEARDADDAFIDADGADETKPAVRRSFHF